VRLSGEVSFGSAVLREGGGVSIPSIFAAAVGVVAAVVLLMPIGSDVELEKRDEGQGITVIKRREFWSVGTLFVTDSLFGWTHLDRYTIAFGVVTSGLVAGGGYAVARLSLSREGP
jgi:hypothetical protein